jgi:hypothetical protein
VAVSFKNHGLRYVPSDPWILLDGRLNAPPGTPQYPNLLVVNNSGLNTAGRTLLARPPWKVAGVDYHVGIDRHTYPTNGSLGDPTTGSLPTGVTYSSASHQIQVVSSPSSPVTLEGWDFSLGGGLQVYNKGVANSGGCDLTIRNCNFKIGTTTNLICYVSDADSGSLTMVNTEIDGNGAALFAALGTGNAQGTLVGGTIPHAIFRYCWWHDAAEDGYDPNCGPSVHQTIEFKYCLLDTCSYDVTYHSDWLQINNSESANATLLGHTDNCVCLFNTNYQRSSATNNQQSMFRLNTQVDASEIAYNTAICDASTAQVNTYFDIVEATGTFPTGDDPCQILNPSLHDNYCIIDTTGNTAHVWFNGFYTNGALPLAHGIVNPTETGNIDMSTGSLFPLT